MIQGPRLGELMRRVGRRATSEVVTADAWTREEVQNLLALAREHAPHFAPALELLFSTGVRRGELLGLAWEDVDFARQRIHIRRAYVRDEMTTPRRGRGRYVAMSPGLGSLLIDLLAARRTEAMRRGWPEAPEIVFPTETGGPMEARYFERTWLRLRRKARNAGVRPLTLHCTRHTWARMALAAGK